MHARREGAIPGAGEDDRPNIRSGRTHPVGDVVEILDLQGVADLRAVESDPANPVVVVNKRQSHS